MNKEVSIRQIVYMYLFLSLSPILRQMPSALAKEAGRSGYLSPLWSIMPLLPLAGIILLLIKRYPGLNIYEVMEHLAGKFLAKVFILGYLFWFLLLLTAKVNIYSLTLQFTLMPKTRSDFFMITLIILVYYAMMRGMKTIFRFSEFTLGPVILLIGILFFCALTRLRTDYLLPISTIKLPSTISASRHVVSVGGNILIALFFADKFGISVTNEQKRKLWYGILFFTLFSFAVTVLTFGITGPDLTANIPFPFYITVKSISFFNIFERFEVLVTLICMLSDFVSICLTAVLLMRCLNWLCGIKQNGMLFIPVTVIVYYFTYFLSSTQFEFEYLYRTVIINLSLVFQYAIPLLLAFLSIVTKKKLKNIY